jgi:hypothetical protein
LWDDEPQCGDMQRKERIDHDEKHKGSITKSKTIKKSYACYIYGLNGHKMTNCPKFVEM